MSDQRPDRVVVYRDAAGEWRWRRVAPNGEPLSDSGEGYAGGKWDAADAARRANPDVTEVEIEEKFEE